MNKKSENKTNTPMTNQTQIIEKRIEYYLNKGMTDKQEIYTKVVLDLNVPRPTVRRVSRGLRAKYLEKVDLLQKQLEI